MCQTQNKLLSNSITEHNGDAEPYDFKTDVYLNYTELYRTSVPASHNTESVSFMKTNQLMLFCEAVVIYGERELYRTQLKVKCSRYRPGVSQRVGRGIALLFHDRGTRRGWVVNSTPRPHFTPGKDPVPIVQEAGWVPGPVWKGGKSRLHRDSIQDRPARSQSLYRLSYRAHTEQNYNW